jgi:hypothetical protein
VLGEPISAKTIQTNAKAFCPAVFINTLLEKIHPWHSVSIKAVTPWSVQFTLGSHRANFYASSESEGRVRVLTTWGSGVSMALLVRYADQMDGFAKHINGILEGKIRDDEGKLVEVLLHDKPQADGSIGVALNHGYPPILERRDKDGDVQYWDLEGGVLYDSRFQPVDTPLHTFVLYGTGNKQFDGRSCEVIDHPNPGGKCQVKVGESVTWVDSSMLWKPGQIPAVKKCSSRTDDPIESYAKTVRSDNDFAWTIFCNLAMMAKDAGAPIEKANERSADLMKHWFGVDVRENELWSKSASSHAEQASTCVDHSAEERWIVGGQWTPKIGDWVRINKPKSVDDFLSIWMPGMDQYDGQIVEVKEIDGDSIINDDWAYIGKSIIHDELAFLFDWLERAEQPKAPLNSETIPQGHRKLKDASIEPRKLGDLRWSVSEKRYVEITVDEIGYANRDNWAACRKVEPVVKDCLTPEPPDGWRWLEVGEVIRKGDIDKSMQSITNWWVGEACRYKHDLLRRNRFGVGEKVVDCRTGWLFRVQHLNEKHSIVFVDGVSNGVESKHLAPYIEEFGE